MSGPKVGRVFVIWRNVLLICVVYCIIQFQYLWRAKPEWKQLALADWLKMYFKPLNHEAQCLLLATGGTNKTVIMRVDADQQVSMSNVNVKSQLNNEHNALYPALT